jgi:hypothetical protein
MLILTNIIKIRIDLLLDQYALCLSKMIMPWYIICVVNLFYKDLIILCWYVLSSLQSRGSED